MKIYALEPNSIKSWAVTFCIFSLLRAHWECIQNLVDDLGMYTKGPRFSFFNPLTLNDYKVFYCLLQNKTNNMIKSSNMLSIIEIRPLLGSTFNKTLINS